MQNNKKTRKSLGKTLFFKASCVKERKRYKKQTSQTERNKKRYREKRLFDSFLPFLAFFSLFFPLFPSSISLHLLSPVSVCHAWIPCLQHLTFICIFPIFIFVGIFTPNTRLVRSLSLVIQYMESNLTLELSIVRLLHKFVFQDIVNCHKWNRWQLWAKKICILAARAIKVDFCLVSFVEYLWS